MAGKREKPEDIVLKLRQVEDYGGMSRDQLKRLKELETENTRLKRVVADLSLDKLILTEAARGNF